MFQGAPPILESRKTKINKVEKPVELAVILLKLFKNRPRVSAQRLCHW